MDEAGNDVAGAEEQGEAPEQPEQEATQAQVDDSQADEAADADESADEPKDALELLIAQKYGGDRGKFVEGLHNQWQSTAALRRELDELKARAAEPDYDLEEVEDQPVENPELQQVTARLTSLDNSIRNTEAQRNKILSEIGQADREIAALEGRLASAEDVQKYEIQLTLARKQTAFDSAVFRYENLEARLSDFQDRKQDLEYRKGLAERETERLKTQNKEAAIRDGQLKARWRSEFGLAVAREAQALGLDEEGQEYMTDVLRAQLSFELGRRVAKGLPGLDIDQAVSELSKKFSRVSKLGRNAAFTKMSQQKAQARPVTAKTSQASKPNTSGGKAGAPSNGEAVDYVAEAEKIRTRMRRRLGLPA